jgi:Fur family transcriptional regulator, peroxide stress response regulator
MSLNAEQRARLETSLADHSLRATRQREEVYRALVEHLDHPTADELYLRLRESLPSVSLATIYNCLETLVDVGLVRAVHYERQPTRYCPNLQPHAHFRDRQTGSIVDIPLPNSLLYQLRQILPGHLKAESLDIVFQGHIEPATAQTSLESLKIS